MTEISKSANVEAPMDQDAIEYPREEKSMTVITLTWGEFCLQSVWAPLKYRKY